MRALLAATMVTSLAIAQTPPLQRVYFRGYPSNLLMDPNIIFAPVPGTSDEFVFLVWPNSIKMNSADLEFAPGQRPVYKINLNFLEFGFITNGPAQYPNATECQTWVGLDYDYGVYGTMTMRPTPHAHLRSLWKSDSGFSMIAPSNQLGREMGIAVQQRSYFPNAWQTPCGGWMGQIIGRVRVDIVRLAP